MTTQLTRRATLGLVATLALAACESDPAGLDDTLADENAQIEFVVAQTEAVLAEQARQGRTVPFLRVLVRMTRQEIDAQGGHAEGEALLAEAQSLGAEAREAFQNGDTEEARDLVQQSHRKVIEAAIAVLGDSIVQDAVETVRSALDRLQERLEGAELPDRAATALANAEAEVLAAEAALQAGQSVDALDHAIRAAHLLDALRDRIQMRRDRALSTFERAARLLRVATRAAGDDPPDGTAAALEEAGSLLDSAREAFRDGNVQAGTALARQSAEISVGLIRMLRGDDDGGM